MECVIKRSTHTNIYTVIIFLVFCFSFTIPVFSQNQAGQREDIWICIDAETALYSSSLASYGGGLTLAYGNGTSIGFKAAWLFDMANQADVLELDFLFRFYLLEKASYYGPYIQFTGGPALFFQRGKDHSVPARMGIFSGGLTLGWRFLFGKFLFVEPFVRGGYPYIAAAGVSAGMRF